MLEALGKIVILTGSQVPIFDTRSDGLDNFLASLVIAANYSIPEVCVFFGTNLLRGNRTSKMSACSFEAFQSPNFPPLATANINIEGAKDPRFRETRARDARSRDARTRDARAFRLFARRNIYISRRVVARPSQVEWKRCYILLLAILSSCYRAMNHRRIVAYIGRFSTVDYRCIFRSCALEKFYVHASLNRNVGMFRLFPGVTSNLIKAFVQAPIEGVVLQSYGAGNVPTNRQDIIDVLRAATQRGVIIVNITQCSTGCVSDEYEAGKLLQDAGKVTLLFLSLPHHTPDRDDKTISERVSIGLAITDAPNENISRNRHRRF